MVTKWKDGAGEGIGSWGRTYIYIDTTLYNIDNQQRPTTKPQATLLEIL